MKGNIKKTTYKPNSCCPQSSFLSLCWSFACVWTHSWWAWSVGIEWVELQVASQGPSVIGKPLPQKRIIPPRVECGKLWLNKPQLNDTHLAKKTRTDDPKIPVMISLQPCACSWPQAKWKRPGAGYVPLFWVSVGFLVFAFVTVGHIWAYWTFWIRDRWSVIIRRTTCFSYSAS